ncbi:MAG: tetratricopeptide repeat protein, partial [Raineya sp.]
MKEEIETLLEKEKDLDVIIYQLQVLLYKDMYEQRDKCRVLDNLLAEYKDKDPRGYAILRHQKLLHCSAIKNSKLLTEEYLNAWELALEKIENKCEKIIFWTDFSLHLSNNLDEPNLANKYLQKAKNSAKSENCENYYLFILVYETMLFKNKKQTAEELAKLIETKNFYEEKRLSFPWSYLNLHASIAYIYYRSEKYEASERHWKRVVEISEKNKWLYRTNISSYNTLGLVQKNLKKYDEAEQNFLKAIKIAEEIKDSIWIAIPQGNIAEIDIIRKDYEKAEERLNIYLNYAKKFKEHGIVVSAYIKLADLYSLKEDKQNALLYLKNAEDYLLAHQEKIAKTDFLSMLYYQKKLFEAFVKVLEKQKQFDKAFYYSQKLLSIKDSINTIINKEKVSELEGRYRLKEKEKENKLLQEINQTQARNQEIIIWSGFIILLLLIILLVYLYSYVVIKQKYAKNLENLNQFKNKIFSIVSHDLRSYMSSLKGYVYLVQSQELDKEDLLPLTQELSKNTEQTFS